MLESQAIIEAVISHAAASGHFDSVQGHEPKSAPGNDLNASVWVDSIAPFAEHSGLDATSAKVVLSVRVFNPMLSEPQDGIDPKIMNAVDELMRMYSGDFTLDGLVRNVDLLGMDGEGMRAEAGYVEIDKKLYRIMTITLPMIVNDVWTQNP